jgi:hypothetical protein
LENVTALLLANTVAAKNLTGEEFMEAQKELNQPMVIFCDKGKNKVIHQFNIVAETMDKLEEMYKLKYFETSDIPEGQYQKVCNAYFIGVGPKEIKKERTAVTVRSL